MLSAVVRLLDEDPDGWYVCDDHLIHKAVVYKIRFGSGGPEAISGFVLGWWGRFVLRRAIWRRQALLVDQYLAQRSADRLAAEEAEADRLLAGR